MHDSDSAEGKGQRALCPFAVITAITWTCPNVGTCLRIHCDRRSASARLCCCSCCYCWSLLYSAVLRSQADSLRSHVILHEWLAFYSAFLHIHRSGGLTALFDCFMPSFFKSQLKTNFSHIAFVFNYPVEIQSRKNFIIHDQCST